MLFLIGIVNPAKIRRISGDKIRPRSGHTDLREADTNPLLPRRAPEGLSGFARQGRGKDAARFSQGLDAPSKKPAQTRGAQD